MGVPAPPVWTVGQYTSLQNTKYNVLEVLMKITENITPYGREQKGDQNGSFCIFD